MSTLLLERVVCAFESFSARPYRDAAGYWTIGYGHRIPTGAEPAIDIEEGLVILRTDLANATAGVFRCVRPRLGDLPIHELGALTSFVFNLGEKRLSESTLLRCYMDGDRIGAAREFLRWVYAAGVVLPGLVRRRHAESVWFLGAADETVLYLAEQGWRDK